MPAHNRDKLARSAVERSRLYSLLANVFRREPSAEFLCHLNTPEMAVAFSGAGIELGDEFRTAKFANLAENLAVEYTRLFLGPGKHISPHESVQLKRCSGILWGPETSAVRNTYRRAGLDIGEAETVIPDHISVELDFLSHLSKQEAAAWRHHGAAAKFLHLQHSFISRHLGKWAARFCSNVVVQAEFAFYPAFANLLRSYLSGEKAEIANRLSLIGANDQPMKNDPNNNHLQSVNG